MSLTLSALLALLPHADAGASPAPPPCEVLQQVTADDATWSRCADSVWRTAPDAPPVQVRLPEEGMPVALFAHQDRVWVEIRREVAVPLSGENATTIALRSPSTADPEAPPSSKARDAEQPDRSTPVAAHGRVEAFIDGEPVIGIGTDEGISLGTILEFYETIEVQVGNRTALQERPIAAGIVKGIGEDVAEVRLGLNQSVPMGAMARVVDRQIRKRLLAPPRTGGFGFMNLLALGVVSMSDSGGGGRLHGSIGYRAPFPLVVQLDFTPISLLGVEGHGFFGNASVVAFASFDHPLFAVGLGGGLAVDQRDPTLARGLFAQHLRFGALDGLMMDLKARFDQGSSGIWHLDHLEGIIQIPLGAGRTPTWVVVRAGGGTSDRGGQGHGHLAARFRVAGKGGPGSLSLSPYLGVVGRNTVHPRPAQVPATAPGF